VGDGSGARRSEPARIRVLSRGPRTIVFVPSILLVLGLELLLDFCPWPQGKILRYP
jgi:hypothetical protein